MSLSDVEGIVKICGRCGRARRFYTEREIEAAGWRGRLCPNCAELAGKERVRRNLKEPVDWGILDEPAMQVERVMYP